MLNWLQGKDRKLLLVLSLALILHLIIVFKVPLIYGPLETGYYSAILHIVRDEDIMIDYRYSNAVPSIPYPFISEALQPPLYFFLMSLLIKAACCIKPLELFYLIRIVTSLIAVASIYVAFKCFKIMFPQNKPIQYSSIFFMAVWPAFLSVTSAIHNEALALLLINLCLLVALKIAYSGKDSALDFLKFGFLLGLALLTRLTALPLIPFTAFLFHATRKRGWLKKYAFAAALVLLLNAWLFVKNYWRYGHILPYEILVTTSPGISVDSLAYFFGKIFSDTMLHFEFQANNPPATAFLLIVSLAVVAVVLWLAGLVIHFSKNLVSPNVRLSEGFQQHAKLQELLCFLGAISLFSFYLPHVLKGDLDINGLWMVSASVFLAPLTFIGFESVNKKLGLGKISSVPVLAIAFYAFLLALDLVFILFYDYSTIN